MNNEEPQNLIFSLKEAAVAMHEMYISLQEAGFNKKEAMQIVLSVATGGPKY